MPSKRNIFFTLLVALIWMAGIFYMSSQPADQSAALSRGVTEKVVKTIERVVAGNEFSFEELHHLVRKNAHFFMYFVLGGIFYHLTRFLLLPRWKTFVYALGLSALYAVTDEWHQLYVPGRGGQLTDVLIDSAGALTGILLYIALFDRRARRKITRSNQFYEGSD